MGNNTSRPRRIQRRGFDEWRRSQTVARAETQPIPNRRNESGNSGENIPAIMRMLQAASSSEMVNGVPVRSVSLDGDTFRELLGLQYVIRREQEVEMTKMLTTLRQLYAASKSRILVIADKLTSSETCCTENLLATTNQVEIPQAESWDFQLGDLVRIKYTMADFKTIQSETMGWIDRLRTIHSCEAVVTRRWSEFANDIAIYVPSTMFQGILYAGVLEKIPESEKKEENLFCSRWKVNDYVMIQSSTGAEIVKFLQRGFKAIPERYIGRRGRIIAVTNPSIVVTFNDRTSYHIHPALVTKCPEQSPLVIPERKHPRGFVLGQKVLVRGNIKELINDQSKRAGGWAPVTSKCVGKEVTITHIRKSGNLLVRYKYGESSNIHPLSLLPQSTPIHIPDDIGSVCRRGDIVKVNMLKSTQTLMRILKSPTEFEKYLSIPAKVVMIDDNFDYLIRYHKKQMTAVLGSTVRRATADEKHHYYRIKSTENEIKIGSSVCMDVGPPSYVNAVLQNAGFDDDIVIALTTRSILLGFDASDGKAVIECETGKKYKIKKEHLTIPDKFSM